MFNINKKHNLKKLILISLCLLFGLALSGVFVWQTNAFENKNIQGTIVFEEPISSQNSFGNSFKLEWGNFNNKSGVQLLSVSNGHDEMLAGYKITLSESFPTNISAGTAITLLDKGNNIYRIEFDANDDGVLSGGSDGYAEIEIGAGYEIDFIKAGSLNLEVGDKTTPEEIDPNFAGTLSFEVKVKKITYYVDFFYRNENGSYDNETKDQVDYDIETPITSENSIFNKKINNEDVHWVFRVDEQITDADTTVAGIQYSPSGYDTIVFTFDNTDQDYPIQSGGFYFYKIIGVSGYGNFIGGEGQDATNPTIIAYALDNYSIKVVNDGATSDGTTYWKSLYETLSDDDKETLEDVDIYGVKVSETSTSNTTEVELTGINKSSGQEFLVPEGKAFNESKFVNAAYGYLVYNYGFDLTHYEVTLEYEDGTVKYLTYNNGWNLADGQTQILASNLDEVLIYSIVQFLNDNAFTLGDVKLPTLTLTPIWKAAEIDVKVGNNLVETITYATNYSLAAPTTETEGLKFFCYKDNDENYLANNAIWNYTNLKVSYSSSKYVLNVEPVNLSNVYKVALNGIISSKTYQLETTDFAFASNGNAYTATSYDYTALNGIVGAYSTEEFPLTDSYKEVLTRYFEDYIESVDGDGENDHEIFKKVYYSTGTLNSGVLTATDPNFHIYLAHNQVTGNLPMFKHDYAKVIAWNDNAETSYKTSGYGEDNTYEAELESDISNETWVYDDNVRTIFKALYVYGLNLYFEDNNSADGTFSSIHEEWYGANTKLHFSKEPTEKPENKEYNSWMIDAKTANSQGYTITESKDGDNFVEIAKDGVWIKFKYGSATVKEETNEFHNFYFNVSEVTCGSGVFIQNDEYPIVRAGYVMKHEILIDNSNNYWTELNNDTSLFGAVSTGTADGQSKTLLTVSSKDTNKYKFQADTDVAFLKSDAYNKEVIANLDGYIDVENYYYVYNYGYYVSDWKISYDDLVWNGTTWVTGNNVISVSNLSSITFNDIAASIDENFPTLLGVARITLTPVWTGATIKLSNGDDVIYGANYSLTPADDIVGQKFFCYVQGTENYIANNAVWNYLEITGYEYLSGVAYTLDITPTYLDNVYKIILDSVLPTTKYELETTDFEYSLDGDKYTGAEYNYTDLKGAVAIYNSTTYPFVENYVSSVIVSYINDYANIIDGTNPKHEIFRKVYYSTGSLSGEVLTANNPVFHIYLANNQLTGNLPMFKHDYSKIIAWNYNVTTSNTTLGYGEDATFEAELAVKVGDGTWTYVKDKTNFEAVYVYRLDLFYLNKTGDYATEKAQWYGPNTKLEKPFDENEDEYIDITDNISPDNVFNGWMINADVAANESVYNYNVNDNAETKELTISSSSFLLTFKYAEKSSYNPYYYGILSVQGYGIFAQDKKDEKTGKENPIALAKLGRTYDLTIDNSSTYWKNISINDSQLYGAYSNDGQADGYAKTTLKVANKADYAYPFQTSANGELSFKKLADMSVGVVNSKVTGETTKYYYVYNYGHYISGWKMSSSGQTFVYDGSKWVVAAQNTDSTSLSVLNGVTFKSFAAFMDDFYAAAPENKVITLQPIWSAVNIKIQDSSKNVLLNNKTFASTYTLDTAKIARQTGKEIIAFTYGGESDLIALSSVWNYYNKNNSATDISDLYEYKTEAGDANGAGTYTLTVSPVWVDNIYKVNLTNAKVISQNKYKLTDTDYSFNAINGSYHSSLTTECIKYDQKIDNTYNYQSYDVSGLTLADDYIVQLIGYRTQYNQGIANGSFEIFRKVYYSLGSVATTTNSNDTLNVTSTPTFWIYLANNQATGALPVFEEEYYSQIFWQNTLHADGTACVGVDACVIDKHYIYKTNKFDEAIHAQEVENYMWHKNAEDGTDREGIWTLSDGHKDNAVTLQACYFYFRNYYNIEVSTLVGAEIERRGYVTIDIVDKLYKVDNTIENVGGKYIIIAEEDRTTGKMEMKVYEVSALGNSLITYTDVMNKIGALSEAIKLYEGCDITVSVKDQSKDPDAMASKKLDDMIGYKFSKDIDQTITTVGTADTDVFSKSDDYCYVSTSTSIASKNYPAGSTFKINVYFEKIIYNIDFVIDTAKAGEFNVQFNQLYSGYKTSYRLADVSVDNFYEVSYFAYAGYILQENAFKYFNGVTELFIQKYNDADPNQIYTLTSTGNKFDGAWLRDWFYSSVTDYSVDRVYLGTITIQTDVIEFSYGVKVYETDENDTYEMIEELEDGTFTLNKTTGLGSVNAIGKYLTKQEADGFYYYKSTTNVIYALLSSRMFIPTNPITTRDNSYITYDFLLTEEPTTQTALTPSILAFMVTNYEDGKIIPNNCRKIYIMLEVRELLVVTMQVKALGYDTNNSTRTTVLSNGTNNSKTITLTNGQGQDAEGYFADGSNRKTVKVYTYNGLENTLNSEYDTSKYSGVKYTIGTSVDSLTSNTFNVDKDSTITIEYVPKTLDIEFVYLLNDIDVTFNYVEDIITQTVPTVLSGLTVGDVVNYSLELKNNDYNARVTINSDFGSSVSTDNENSQISIEHIINDADMAWGMVEIMVEVYPKNNARININLALDDPSKRDVDDNYGTFSVYINGDLIQDRVKTAEIDIIETRDVHVSLELPLGYSYVGIKMGTYSVNEVPADSQGKILMIENFEVSKAGDYVIVVKKDDISARLDVGNVQTSGFKTNVFINGAKELNNLYIGASVEFAYEDQNEERLNYFYYTYNNGTKDVEVKIDEKTSFKITNDILELYPDKIVKFGVKTIMRYKFVATVIGQQYLEEEVIVYYSDRTPYTNGTYCDVGTQLTFTVKPIGVSEGKFKYDITCEAGEFNVINQFDVIVTLNKNIDYKITISPKQYQVTISENIYNDITQVENGTPEKVEENQVNNLNILGQTTYNSETTLEFTRVAYKQDGLLDRELSKIVIENNDSDEVIIIEFIGTTYVATIDGVGINLANYGYIISNLTSNSNTIKLTYVTLNNVSITVDYKDYKVISGG